VDTNTYIKVGLLTDVGEVISFNGGVSSIGTWFNAEGKHSG